MSDKPSATHVHVPDATGVPDARYMPELAETLDQPIYPPMMSPAAVKNERKQFVVKPNSVRWP